MRTPLTILLLAVLFPAFASSVVVTSTKVEGMQGECLGLDTSQPRFSWTIGTEDSRLKNVVQKSYRILVASTEELLLGDKGDLWDSGEVECADQLWIPFGGTALKSNCHAFWKVRVHTNQGASEWSTVQHFSTGLLGETAWRGRWIGLEQLQAGEQAGVTHSRLAARYLRKDFPLQPKPVRRATAFVAAVGLYRFFVNGQEVGAHEVLKPSPSDYRRTIYYQTYDVTPFFSSSLPASSLLASSLPASSLPSSPSSLPSDSCSLFVVLGNGKYFAPRQDKPYKNVFFGLPKCRVNVVLDFTDGTTQRLVTDETWQVSALGPIRANNEYDGEEYDARLEDLLAPSSLTSLPSCWQPAQRSAIPQGTLRGRVQPPMVARPLYSSPLPLSSSPCPVYDFGQNISGWVSFLPCGKSGDTIRVRYAERLNSDGTLYFENLRDARSEDIYVCNGHDREWMPSFVYHGFRYVSVHGPARQVQAWFVTDQMEPAGQFECSDTILNKVLNNARWGIACNYKGVPVDCPQRNERQPWLGDRTVGALGESYFFDNERLYTKWMRDICEAQREDGCIPDVAPAFWNYYTDDVTWPAALPFICQTLWEQYGNDEAIRLCYPNIRRWLHHILDSYLSADGLITKDKYGDWCMPPERLELIHSNDPARQTDGTLIATAYTIRCLQLAAVFARHLGLSDDAGYWTKRQEIMTADFNRHYLTYRLGTSPRPGHPFYPDSIYYGNNTATANLLSLAFGICPDSLRAEVAKQVVENIMVRNKGHVSSGVIGISWLLRMLSECGYADVAWLLATNRTYPSWGYMTEQGATTIWELWNGDHADPKMNSGNHVMLLGDLVTWCFQYLAGICPSSSFSSPCAGSESPCAAFQGGFPSPSFVLSPLFALPACSFVRCQYNSSYGPVVSNWQKTDGRLDWHVAVPCNTSATLCFPDGTVKTVGSGVYDFSLDLPSSHPLFLTDELITPGAPSAHASTIAETPDGNLVVAYFAGTYERNPDCNIYVHVREKGSKEWSPAILAADGMTAGSDASSSPVKKACWNPVLTAMPSGELWLFYKVGKTVGDWTGWLVRSADGGYSWSKPEPLPQGFLGPVKNKPLLLRDSLGHDRLVCGSSTEGHGWRFHVEILDLSRASGAAGRWRYVGPVVSTTAVKTDDNQPHPIDCIQPSILQLADGRLQVLMRTHNARLATSYSSDNGDTWSPVTLTGIVNNQSGTDAVTLLKPFRKDGMTMHHVLVYNNFETLPHTKKGPRTPLSLALSPDGQSWYHWLTLEDSPAGEYSYPAIIQGSDGTLHCTYTWQRKRIAYKRIALP